MRQFRNNLKRSRSRNHSDRSFKRNSDIDKLNGNFSNNDNSFRRKINRSNGNVQKLISKYNDLAREALSNGDKILSENYFQHADHFTRILNEQESFKKARFSAESMENKNTNEENNEGEKVKKEDSEKKIFSEKKENEAEVVEAK